MSAYPLYDKKIMEALRQLTIEEMLMALHDLAAALEQDRLRDVGLSMQMFGNEDYPIRPAVHGWDAVDLAMRSAGYTMGGFKQKSDLVEFLGEELAEDIWSSQLETLDMVKAVGTIMQEEGCTDEEALEKYQQSTVPPTGGEAPPVKKDAATKMKESMEASKLAHPAHPGSFQDLTKDGVPDDLSGFGWGNDGH